MPSRNIVQERAPHMPDHNFKAKQTKLNLDASYDICRTAVEMLMGG
jgi:hypothetical protein